MSGLEFREEGELPASYIVQERLALTEDDRLVPEDHPDARWLYAVPGREIPFEQAVRYGLVAPAAAPKARRKGAIKKGDEQ